MQKEDVIQCRQSRQECQSRLLVSKYSFLPGALLNGKMSELCADLDKLRQCEQETRPCEAEVIIVKNCGHYMRIFP